jgi:hypothetical protein
MFGINGNTHLELEQFIDLTEFDNIQIDIWKGLALSKNLAIPAQFKNPTDEQYKSYSNSNIKPLFSAYTEFCKLPDDSPLKQAGLEIEKHSKHAFAEFIRYAFEAHDHYTLYNLLESDPGWTTSKTPLRPTEVSNYFPSLVEWILNLVDKEIFTCIGRAYLISLDSFGVSFEHRDAPADPESTIDSQFLHIRPNLKRPFYVYDPDSKEKFYVKSRVGWWNDKDTHGGDSVPEPTYAIRIDGVFSNMFKNKILSS